MTWIYLIIGFFGFVFMIAFVTAIGIRGLEGTIRWAADVNADQTRKNQSRRNEETQ